MSGESTTWSRRRFLKGTAAAGLAGSSVLPEWSSDAHGMAVHSPDRDLLARLDAIPADRHPRLHVTEASLEGLRQQAATTHRRYRNLLMDWMDDHRDRPLALDPTKGPLLERSASYVTCAALSFLFEKRPADLEVARKWTLEMTEYPAQELRKYNLGTYAAGLARSYDWLYDEWSNKEKKQIRDHLAFLIRQVYRGSFPNQGQQTRWWANKHLHHDYWIPVGGYGEAALALLGEVDDASLWAERAKRSFDEVFSWLGNDGAWHEGAADWCYAVAPLLWFYGAWETAVGEDLHQGNAWIENTATYRLYHWLPDDTYVYLNDSFRSGRYGPSGTASAHLLRRLAGLFNDGYAQWLADRDEPLDLQEKPPGVYQAPYESSSYSSERRDNIWSPALTIPWSLLWYDPSVEPVSPDERPLQHWFPNKDVAILRTGWNSDETVVSFACGPTGGHRVAERIRAGEKRHPGNVSHGHANYNSITLFARNRYFIVPPGYARRGSYFHNTAAVNGANFRYDLACSVHLDTVSSTAGLTYARGDGTDGFLRELNVERFYRHLILLEEALVIIDDVRVTGDNHPVWNHFQWTLHHDPREHRLSIEGSNATWVPTQKSDGQLRLNLLAPDAFAWERSTIQDQKGGPMLEALRMLRPEWYDNRIHVVGVLSWSEEPAEPRSIERGPMVGVTWPDSSQRPGVLVALDEISEENVQNLGRSAIPDGEAYVFSTDSSAPARAVHINAGDSGR